MVINSIKKGKSVISSSKKCGNKNSHKNAVDCKPYFYELFLNFRILGVPLAVAEPATRVATFTSIFFANKKGYPLPSLTQKTVVSQKFIKKNNELSSSQFHLLENTFIYRLFQNVDPTTENIPDFS